MQVGWLDTDFGAATHGIFGVFFIDKQLSGISQYGENAAHQQNGQSFEVTSRLFFTQGVDQIYQSKYHCRNHCVEGYLDVVELDLQTQCQREEQAAPYPALF